MPAIPSGRYMGPVGGLIQMEAHRPSARSVDLSALGLGTVGPLAGVPIAPGMAAIVTQYSASPATSVSWQPPPGLGGFRSTMRDIFSTAGQIAGQYYAGGQAGAGKPAAQQAAGAQVGAGKPPTNQPMPQQYQQYQSSQQLPLGPPLAPPPPAVAATPDYGRYALYAAGGVAALGAVYLIARKK